MTSRLVDPSRFVRGRRIVVVARTSEGDVAQPHDRAGHSHERRRECVQTCGRVLVDPSVGSVRESRARRLRIPCSTCGRPPRRRRARARQRRGARPTHGPPSGRERRPPAAPGTPGEGAPRRRDAGSRPARPRAGRSARPRGSRSGRGPRSGRPRRPRASPRRRRDRGTGRRLDRMACRPERRAVRAWCEGRHPRMRCAGLRLRVGLGPDRNHGGADMAQAKTWVALGCARSGDGRGDR